MKPPALTALPLVLLSLIAPPPAAAAASWTGLNLAVVDEHVVPRYRQLADDAAILEKRSREFCAAPDAEGLESVRSGFHQTMDAWMGIQHIRFGPVELFLRYNRIHYWPDKHNTGARQLRRALSDKDVERLTPEEFEFTSVALQGLGTLERLLYDSGTGLAQFVTDDSARPSYRCRFVEAISRNLAAMSRDIVLEWIGGEPSYREVIRSAEQGNQSFESASEVSGRFLNNLYTELQLIVDQKLLPPLGGNGTMINARSAESWRSRRSLRNIVLNLEAAESFYETGFSPAMLSRDERTKALDRRIRDDFAAVLNAARSIDGSLFDAIESQEQRPAVKLLLEAASELKRDIGGPLPLALDLSRGFNSLDGD